MLSRRHFIEGSAALGLVAAFAPAALAQRRTQTETVDVAQLMQPGPLGDVWLGKADAPVTIVEYASSPAAIAPASTPARCRS